MSTTAPSAEAAAQLLFPPNVQYNNSRLYSVKFLSSCFAGAVAGVLGLENALGFALFILSTLFTSACLYLKCKSRPAKYVPGGWWELVNPGQENMFSFVLVWTLFYGGETQELYTYTIEPSSQDGRNRSAVARTLFCLATREVYAPSRGLGAAVRGVPIYSTGDGLYIMKSEIGSRSGR